jgi:hypothetical protein
MRVRRSSGCAEAPPRPTYYFSRAIRRGTSPTPLHASTLRRGGAARSTRRASSPRVRAARASEVAFEVSRGRGGRKAGGRRPRARVARPPFKTGFLSPNLRWRYSLLYRSSYAFPAPHSINAEPPRQGARSRRPRASSSRLLGRRGQNKASQQNGITALKIGRQSAGAGAEP